MIPKSTIPLVAKMTTTLQQDVDCLSKWCDKWLSFLNFSKCKHVSVGCCTSHRQYYFYSNGITYPTSTDNNEKYLGITFNSNMQFKSHINLIIHKANNILGIIKRTFRSRDANTIRVRLLYTIFVRPILDYASIIWHPSLMGDIWDLEKVERRATKLTSFLENSSYDQKLQQLINLLILLYRCT